MKRDSVEKPFKKKWCRVPESSPTTCASLLDAATRGEPSAAEELLPLLYGELRRLAQSYLSKSPPGDPNGWAPTTSSPATADVASAARVRWDLAMTTG